MKTNKIATSIRLSLNGKRILEKQSSRFGLSQASFLELLLKVSETKVFGLALAEMLNDEPRTT